MHKSGKCRITEWSTGSGRPSPDSGAGTAASRGANALQIVIAILSTACGVALETDGWVPYYARAEVSPGLATMLCRRRDLRLLNSKPVRRCSSVG
jgi:hypothetical protein